MYGQEAVATQLLKANASVKAVNVYGSTSLHIAAGYGKAGVVDLLLQANADPKAANNNGQTPRQWAESGGYKDIPARLLKEEQAAVAK